MTRAAAIVLALLAGPAAAGDPPAMTVPMAEPLPLTKVIAASFLPPLGIVHQGDAAGGRIVVLGGYGATAYRVSEGALPEGASLDRDGALAGTFSQAGSYAATVRATTEDARTVVVEVRIDVAPRAPGIEASAE